MSKHHHNQQPQQRPVATATPLAAVATATATDAKPETAATGTLVSEPQPPASPAQSPATTAEPKADAPAPGKRSKAALGEPPEPKFIEINPNDILALVRSYATAIGYSATQVAVINATIVKLHGAAIEALASVFPPLESD